MAKIYTKTGDHGKTRLVGGCQVAKSDARIHAYGTVDELNSHIGLVRCAIESKLNKTNAASEALKTSPSDRSLTSDRPSDETSKSTISNKSSSYLHLNLELKKIQNELFNLGSLLACESKEWFEKMPPITDQHIQQLEQTIDKMTLELKPLKNFILPAGSLASSHAHVARTVCRRAERYTVEIYLAQSLNLKNSPVANIGSNSSLASNSSSIDNTDITVSADSNKVDDLNKLTPAMYEKCFQYLNRLSDYLFVLARYCNHLEGIRDHEWEK